MPVCIVLLGTMLLFLVKIVATRCQILTVKRTKIDFGQGSAADPLGELTAHPRPLAGFKGPTSKGRGREGRGGEEKGGEGRGAPPKACSFPQN